MKSPIVLLAEDSEDDAFFFQHTLEKSQVSCALHHVKNGAEAVKFLENTSETDPENLPTVVFMDLKMPLVNGFEVLEWIRTQPFASSLRVIVLSGSEHEQDKRRAAQLGATEYLVKPVRPAHLQRILQPVCPPQMGVHV
jgi:CheY-like chemotaxis protein